MATPVTPLNRLYSSLVSGCYFLFLCITPLHALENDTITTPKKPAIPDRISIVVRDFDSDTLLSDVIIRIFKDTALLQADKTNDLGYTQIDINNKTKKFWKEGNVTLSYHYPARGNRSGDTITLNTFLTHYELYTAPTGEPGYDPSLLTADIHLQTSLRVHNHFAKQLYVKGYEAPGNLNWYKSYKRSATMYKGRWYESDIEPLNNSRHLQVRRQMMKQLLEGKPMSCKGDNNKLCDYTQATYPHLKKGRVTLSFNPMTPIEKSVANSDLRRIANHFVTGLKGKWLHMINSDMSHFENFKMEYRMLMNLSRDYNHFPVRFYTSGMDLDTNLTTIVNCAEGGHTLHGPLIAKKIDLITSKNRTASRKIIRKHITMIDTVDLVDFQSLYNHFVRLNGKEKWFELPIDSALCKDDMRKVIKRTPEEITNSLTDSLVAKEMMDNVKEFKNTDSFQIWMLNIAHHTYNHLFGHAVAFDQGGLFGGFLSKFIHSSHSSIEHYDSWRRMYYNVSGPTELGKRVMQELITRNEQGHRIIIDLKHSGYSTRKWFFDTVLPDHIRATHDTLPPVCSHCAANGQKEIEYSRYADEFKLRDAPFAKTFYPFELNLYDEEITRIFQADGLIGIKLEQRGLGGYLDKHQIWKKGLKFSGEPKKDGRTSLAKRFSYVRRWLRFYRDSMPHLITPALDYIKDELNVQNGAMKILEDDYVSAEPFLQNLFYFIDHSGYDDSREAWGQLCIGSDLDGVINAIDICPTSAHYPDFKVRLKQFIPVFLKMRQDMYPDRSFHSFDDYFSGEADLDHALDQLFFLSAKNFVEKYFIDKPIVSHVQTHYDGDRIFVEPVSHSTIY